MKMKTSELRSSPQPLTFTNQPFLHTEAHGHVVNRPRAMGAGNSTSQGLRNKRPATLDLNTLDTRVAKSLLGRNAEITRKEKDTKQPGPSNSSSQRTSSASSASPSTSDLQTGSSTSPSTISRSSDSSSTPHNCESPPPTTGRRDCPGAPEPRRNHQHPHHF